MFGEINLRKRPSHTPIATVGTLDRKVIPTAYKQVHIGLYMIHAAYPHNPDCCATGVIGFGFLVSGSDQAPFLYWRIALQPARPHCSINGDEVDSHIWSLSVCGVKCSFSCFIARSLH